MRRAVVLLAVAVLTAGLFVLADAQRVERAPDIIDASGFVSFMERPNFSVGTWAKYRTTSSSVRGYKDDYTVTVLVAGEELFWGEPCFWIESWTQRGDKQSRSTATLLSYAAFGDTMAEKHILWFIRKTINGTRPDGTPDISVYTREKSEVQLRRANWDDHGEEGVNTVDTLGSDTTKVTVGTFAVRKLSRTNAYSQTAEQGDSTVYYERKLTRVFHYSPKIPLTRLVKIDITDLQQGKTWKAGQFDRGPLKVLERADGETSLIGFGTSGVEARLVPASSRRPLDRKLVEEVLNLPSEPPVKPRRSSGSGG